MRGALLATSSAGLAVMAHTLADGDLPDASMTVVLTLVVGWAGAALAKKTTGFRGVLAALGAAQLGMHVVLTGLMGHLVPSGGMMLAHTGATVATALLQAHAEAMLLAAAASLWFLLPVVWRPAPVPARPGRPQVRPRAGSPLASVLLTRVHRRRGPPIRS